MKIKLPTILEIPPRLLPIFFNLNKYSLFLAEGGRGSGKTQSIGRILLYIAEHRKVIICVGRVIKDSVKDSVLALFKNLIDEFNLDFEVTDKRIIHRKTGSVIFFIESFTASLVTFAISLASVVIFLSADHVLNFIFVDIV